MKLNILHNWNMSQDNFSNARNILAKNVQLLRQKAKLNKEELSLLLGFENSYISKLENSRINITLDKIEKIANYFDVNLYKLLK